MLPRWLGLCEQLLSDDALRQRISKMPRTLARTFVWERAAAIEREALDVLVHVLMER